MGALCGAGSRRKTVRRPEGPGETPPIMRMVDVLPVPFGPRKPNASPLATSKSMPSTASRSPNLLVSWRASINELEALTVQHFPLLEFLTWRKAELHCHLDGAVRISTAAELGDFGRPPRMVAPDDCPSQAAYIGYFDDAIAVMQTQAALERIAYELCVDSAAETIHYPGV